MYRNHYLTMKPVIAIVVVLLLIVAGYFAFTYRAAAPIEEVVPTPTDTETQGSTSEESAEVTVVIYTDAGFSPASVSVAVGDTVRFVNNSSQGMWVGADEHPTHTSYDGTSTREHCANGSATTDTFDQCTASPAGTTWEYTFTKAGAWDYHNHARSSHGASVTVTN